MAMHSVVAFHPSRAGFWIRGILRLLLVCSLLPTLPLSVFAETIELVKDPALAEIRNRIESRLPTLGNRGTATLASLAWDTEGLELTGVAEITARHVWDEESGGGTAAATSSVPEALARRTVTFVYGVKNGYIQGDTRLDAIRLATESNGVLYETIVDPTTVDLIAIEAILRENLTAILQALPSTAAISVESRDEYLALRQAQINVHGEENLFFPSAQFAEWANTQNLPDWMTVGPVTGVSGLTLAMGAARSQAMGELTSLTRWLRARDVADPGPTAVRILSGSDVTWPQMSLRWTSITYESRILAHGEEIVPWRSAPHGLFYLIWTGGEGSGEPVAEDAPNSEDAPTALVGSGQVSTATVTTRGTSRLNVRSSPTATAPVIGKVLNGESYSVLAQSEDEQWVKLAIPALSPGEGWVASRYVELGQTVISEVTGVLSSVVTATEIVTKTASAPSVAISSPATAAPTSGGAQARLEGLSGRIAVPVYDAGSRQYNIWTAKPDGSNLTLVVHDASQPAFNREGARLAYRSWLPEDRGVMIADRDGGNPLRYTDFLEDGLPSWSPDSQRVAFSSYREVDRKPRLYYFWTDPYWSWFENRRDWVFRQEPESVYGEDPFWTGDGFIVYLYRTYHPQTELLLMHENGWTRESLFLDPTLTAPAVSPSGEQIAFMSQRDGNWELYVVDRNGENLRRLTDRPSHDGLPAWSPDGQTLAFVSDQNDGWGVWAISATGGKPQLLFSLPGSVDGRVRDEPDYLTHGWLEEQISWGP